LFLIERNAADSPIRTAVLVLHFPGLLVSNVFNLGNGDETLPTLAIMLGLWILFFYRLRIHLRGKDRHKPVTSKGLQIIAIVTILGIVGVLLSQLFGPFPRQMRNMAAAEQHIYMLRPMLQQDTRFTAIALHPFTGSGGSLSVSGELGSERDLSALKQLVASSQPPVEIVYHVSVIPPELMDLLKTNAGATAK